MGWDDSYALQISIDLRSIREAVGDKVNPLEKRLGRPTVDWGDFYECHVLGVLARAQYLLDIEVPCNSARFDALFRCGEQDIASEVATKVPDDFWPYPEFEEHVQLALGDWSPARGYCVVLHDKPAKSNVSGVAEALKTVGHMELAGESLAKLSSGQTVRLTEDRADFFGHPIIEAIQFEDDGGVWFLYGSGKPGSPSFAARLRSKLTDKLHQLPDGRPSMVFVGTVFADQVLDVADLVCDRKAPLFADPGFKKLAAVAWVNVGRNPIKSWRAPCVVKLTSGLTHSFLLIGNPHSPWPLGDKCAKALSQAFCA